MKKQFFYFFSALLILIFSCSKDDNTNNNNNNNNNTPGKGYVKFKLDGKEVLFDIVGTVWADSSGGIGGVTATQSNGVSTFQLILEGVDFAVGKSYSLVDENTLGIFMYTKDKAKPFTDFIFMEPDGPCSGSIKITKKKLNTYYYAFSGTFSGVALDDADNTHQITDGEIYDPKSE